MNEIFKKFCLRGFIFASGGPLIYGIIMLILELTNSNLKINGIDVFKAIISTSLMAFVIAGISVIWEVEKIGLGISILTHGLTLYLCYLITYLLNNWLKKDLLVIGIFTCIFIVGYLIIWLIIYLSIKNSSKKMNTQLENLKSDFND